VFASTASALPVLGKGAVEAALRKRRHKPMFMVDIAVPRDIEPEVGELRDVYLYTIDDLTAIVDDNVRGRKRAAEQAELIIDEGIAAFVRDQRVRDGQDTVKALRRQAESLRDAELARALAELERGGDPAELLKRLANGLTNKLIHRPTVALRDASANERDEVIRVVSQMFALDTSRD
jgi:glutamyl-tRNA reductase